MLRHIRIAAVLLVVTIPAVGQSSASRWDQVKALSAGTFVRVSVASHSVSGQLQDVTDTSLAIESDKKRESFARQDVTRVSVKKQGHRGRNALIGLGAGAAIGATIGAAAYKGCTGFCIFQTTRGQNAGFGALGFGFIGTIVGALIPTGGWREVYKP